MLITILNFRWLRAECDLLRPVNHVNSQRVHYLFRVLGMGHHVPMRLAGLIDSEIPFVTQMIPGGKPWPPTWNEQLDCFQCLSLLSYCWLRSPTSSLSLIRYWDWEVNILLKTVLIVEGKSPALGMTIQFAWLWIIIVVTCVRMVLYRNSK